MTLDEGAREWLKDIEAMRATTFAAQEELRAQTAKLNRCKSAKTRVLQLQGQVELDARLRAQQSALDAETALFFSRVMGITKDSLALKKSRTGVCSEPLIVNTMAASLLPDGTAVFTISGDSVNKTLTNGLPSSNYLLAREALGEELTSN